MTVGTTTSTRPAGGDQAAAFDVNAERVVLGILMSAPAAVGKVVERLTSAEFYNPRHAEIFDAILALHADSKPTESVAVAAYLADAGDLERLGGMPALHECIEAVPTAVQLGFYVDRILETAARRGLQAAGVRIAQAATSPGRTSEEIAALAETLIAKARPHRAELDMVQLGSLINPALDAIETRRDAPPGIKTGFADLDRLLGGMRPKQLITVAGSTSMGKSVALVDIARHVAIRLGLTVALFSLEMSREEIFERIIAAEAGVPHMLIRDGNLTERDWQRISNKLGPMSNAPLFLSDKAPMTVQQIKVCCQRLQKLHGLHLVIVDHLHLVTPSERIADEPGRIANVSRGLKLNLASNLDVPVIAAAQLNRNPSARADKRPQLTDLKYSSAIEQDSDVVILVHRDDYYDKESPRAGEADFIVDKNRNGPKDFAVVAAQMHFSRFVDMAIV